MFFFSNRAAARSFKSKNEAYKLVDNGPAASKRWAVKVR